VRKYCNKKPARWTRVQASQRACQTAG